MNWPRVAEIVGFQVVWLVCALGAAQEMGGAGFAAAGLYLAVWSALQGSWTAILPIAVSGLTGLVVEGALASLGLVHYAAAWPSPDWAPAWIVALWMAFGATLATTAELLGPCRQAMKAAILGAVFGPASYAAASRLGALDIAEPAWAVYGTLAMLWAAIYPLLVDFARRLDAKDSVQR